MSLSFDTPRDPVHPNSPDAQKALPEFVRSAILSDPPNVGQALQSLGMKNAKLMESMLVQMRLLNVDFQKGDVVTLNMSMKEPSISVQRNTETIWTVSLRETHQCNLDSVRNETSGACKALRKEILSARFVAFETAIRNGDRNQAMSAMAWLQPDDRYPSVINIIKSLADDPSAKENLRKVLSSSVQGNSYRFDFLNDPLIVTYIDAYDLFSDYPVLIKSGEAYFRNGPESKVGAMRFLSAQGHPLRIKSGEVVRLPIRPVESGGRSTVAMPQSEEVVHTSSAKPVVLPAPERKPVVKHSEEIVLDPAPSKPAVLRAEKRAPVPKPAELEEPVPTKKPPKPKAAPIPTSETEMPAKKQAPEKKVTNEAEFMQKYGKLVHKACEALGNSPHSILSLIERESHFNETVKSDSVGVMQLTSIVFQDMRFGWAGRAERYLPNFAKVSDSVLAELPAKTAEALSNLRSIATKQPLSSADRQEFNKGIQYLYQHRQDTYVNIMVGNVFFANLDDSAEAESPRSNYLKVLKDKTKILSVSMPQLVSMITHGDASVDRNEIKSAVESLRTDLLNPDNAELHREYIMKYKYNGNLRLDRDASGRASIPHCVYYALATLVGARRRAATPSA